MQLWLDTIESDVITEAAALGLVFGITTNPAILSRAQPGGVRKTIDALLELQPGPVAIQVTAQDSQAMIQEARALAACSPRILVKIFAHVEGYAAMRVCRNESIPLLATGILQPTQALLAANLGVEYIAPYFSHMGDSAKAKKKSLESIVAILRSGTYKTKVLVASLRNLDDLLFCAELGVEAATIKDTLYRRLIMTEDKLQGIAAKFLTDWCARHADLTTELKRYTENQGR